VFIVSKSTEDALKEIRKRKFDVIISDMGRPPDNRAGYTLLRKIRSENVDTPFIIYSIGADIPDHVAEARDKGAFGSTSDPRKLFRLVVKAITTAR
jgi:DNA-binding NtrC family response regulator